MSTSANEPKLDPIQRPWLGPRNLVAAISAGLVIGLLQVAQAASFATLVFGGALTAHLERGIGMALFAAAVGAIVIAAMTSLPVIIGGTQNVPAAILGIAAAGIVATVIDPQRQLVTVLAAVALTTWLTGAFMLALGTFRLTEMVRFLPYPVIGGFLAGTGWLMITGGISSMAGVPFQLSNLGTLLAPDTLRYWLPGFLLGGLILALSSRVHHFLFLPLMILGITAAFYAVAALMGTSPAELSAAGWLLGPFPEAELWRPLQPGELVAVDWAALGQQWPNIVTAVAMSAIALLLNGSALELSLDRDIDMNREMRAAGWANLLSGLGGGLTGYQQLGLTTLNAHFHDSRRLTGLVAGVVCAVMLLLGGRALEWFPKIVFGAILVYLGLGFLRRWVIDAWSSFHRIDFVIIILILAIIASFGFLPGVIFGVIATIIMFVVNYSGVAVVKHALSATNFRSRVTRPPHQLEILDRAGEGIHILQLQGFLFFGTAYNLLDQVRHRLQQPNVAPPRFLLLDFSRVTGLDSTTLLSFSKKKQLTRANDITLVFAGLAANIHRQLEAGGILDADQGVRAFDTLDRALEWCEDQLLQEQGCRPADALPPLRQQLVALMSAEALVDALLPYLERLDLPTGTKLIRQGDPANTLYFIESGQITSQLTQASGHILRLETMMGGRVIGELGFYLRRTRTADVVAEADSVVYRLTRDSLAHLEAQRPEAASALHELIVRLLSERVIHLVGTVEALQY